MDKMIPWQRKGGPPDSINIRGKKYTFFMSFKTKELAIENANSVRKAGFFAVIRPYKSPTQSSGSCIYIRKRESKESIEKAEVRDLVLDAFKELRKDHHFIARANFLCCQSCAGAELSDQVDKAKARGKTINGYVYWHRQDEQTYQRSGRLYLAYSGVDMTTKEVGDIIAKVLEEKGLVIDWNGTPDMRIIVMEMTQQDLELSEPNPDCDGVWR